LLLTLFAIFGGLSLLLIVIGFALDISIFSLVGTISLMLIGGVLLAEGITYKSGELEYSVYGNNFDGYHWEGYNDTAPLQSDKEAFLFHTNQTDSYTLVDDTSTLRIAWLLIILGGLGFALSLFTL